MPRRRDAIGLLRHLFYEDQDARPAQPSTRRCSERRVLRETSEGSRTFPGALDSERAGVPWTGAFALGFLAAAFSLMPGIEQIVAFGSLTFLVLFATVNALHARSSASRLLERAVAYAGAAGCALAVIGLLYHLASEEPVALLVIGMCFAVLIPSRLAFLRARSDADSGRAA